MDTQSEERVRQLTKAVIFRVFPDVRLERDSPTLLQVIDDPGYSQDENDTVREITPNLKYIADTLNAELDEKVFKGLQENTFNLSENFKALGGMKSWRRVTTIICLPCKIAIKLAKSLGIVKFLQIIVWILDYVKANLVPWIMSVGEWLAVLRPRPTTLGWITVVIFMFCFLTGSVIVYNVMRWHYVN